MIELKIIGKYGKDGYQDPETGTEYFNDTAVSPYGELGKLRIDKHRIVQSDPVILVSTPLTNNEHTTFSITPMNYTLMTIEAENGTVEYQIYPDEVKWEDQEGLEPLRLGTLTAKNWTVE